MVLADSKTIITNNYYDTHYELRIASIVHFFEVSSRPYCLVYLIIKITAIGNAIIILTAFM